MIAAIGRAIRHEFGLKVLSLLAAAVMWLYVMNTENPMRVQTLERRIEAINIPAGLSIAKVRPDVVRVHVQGRLSGLEQSRLSRLRVVADLSGGKLGRNQVALTVVGVPERVEATSMDRAAAQVWLDSQTSRTLQVTPLLEGRPAEGYTVTGLPEPFPTTASVSGAASAVEKIYSIIARVEVSNLSASREVRARLEARDEQGAPVGSTRVSPEFASVRLNVTQAASRKLKVTPLLTAAPSGWVVSDTVVEPRETIITGSEATLDQMSEVPTARVDIQTLRGTRTVQVELQLPSDARAAGDDATVQVTITTSPRPDAGVGPRRESSQPRVQRPERDKGGGSAPAPRLAGPASGAAPPTTDAAGPPLTPTAPPPADGHRPQPGQPREVMPQGKDR